MALYFLYSRGGSGSGRGGDSGGAIRPLEGYQVKPRYPELASRLGIEGTVLLSVVLYGVLPYSTALYHTIAASIHIAPQKIMLDGVALYSASLDCLRRCLAVFVALRAY